MIVPLGSSGAQSLGGYCGLEREKLEGSGSTAGKNGRWAEVGPRPGGQTGQGQ